MKAFHQKPQRLNVKLVGFIHWNNNKSDDNNNNNNNKRKWNTWSLRYFTLDYSGGQLLVRPAKWLDSHVCRRIRRSRSLKTTAFVGCDWMKRWYLPEPCHSIAGNVLLSEAQWVNPSDHASFDFPFWSSLRLVHFFSLIKQGFPH